MGSSPSCLRDQLAQHEEKDEGWLTLFAVVAALCVNVALLLVTQVVPLLVLGVYFWCMDSKRTVRSSSACSEVLSVETRQIHS